MPDVDAIIRRQGQLESMRTIFDTHWAEVAERAFPRTNIFRRSGPITEGEKRTEKVFDSTATLALERFAAAMESMLTPRTQRWHKLTPVDPSLEADTSAQVWMDRVNTILFAARYSPSANFASQTSECWMSVGAFGNCGLFIQDYLGGIRYRAVHLAELFWQENHVGIIDTVHRKYPMTARQMVQRFPDTCPEPIKTKAERSPDSEYEVIHAVQPREEVETNRADYRGMAFASCFISVTGHALLEEGGYRMNPYAIGRYVTGPREVYGRGPLMTVLPDIKMVNEMSKTILRSAHRAVDPPIMLNDDGALQPFSLRPGDLNYGYLDAHGQPLAVPFESKARVDIGLEMLDSYRKVINDAALVTLFQILVDNPQMTATEALLRAQEKGALLAPTMGRQQSEFLGPLIRRELDILYHSNMIPPPPPSLVEAGGVKIEYSSPLNRLMRADDGVAILRTMEQLAPLAQVDPKVMRLFDSMRTARELAEINGVPAKVFATDDELAAAQQQDMAQAQAAALLTAAPVAASSAKDLATAASTARNIPPPQPGIGGPPA